MTDASPAPVREGDVLAKKYRVEKVLGVGGMGVVVSAMHLQLDRRVALKFLLPAALANKEIVARFAREARAAAQIKSEHVARVIDVGELESGSPYMVMEFLEGEDLDGLLERAGAQSIADAVSFILQACDALAEAHALGIVHRDLKPANLFLARRPDKTSFVKVLDFGISKATSPSELQLTSTETILGSPYYMSPEQLTATKNVDPRSDIWALGVILYELLTHQRPFDAEAMPGLVLAIVHGDPPPLAELRRDVPPPLRAAIMRCLEKDRALRFPSVGAFVNALAPFSPESTRHIPERIGRVLGEPPSAPAPASIAEPLLRTAPLVTPFVPIEPAPIAPASFEPRDALAQSARSAWGGTRADTPPARRAFPMGAVVGGGLLVLALATAATFYATTRGPHASSASSASARSELTPPSAPPSAAAVPESSSMATATTIIIMDAGATASAAASSPPTPGASAKRPRPAVAAATTPEPPPVTQPAPQPAAAEPTNKMKMEWK